MSELYWEIKSVIQLQRRPRREYEEQASVRQSIKQSLEQFQEQEVSCIRRAHREQYKLSRHASVIYSPANGTLN
jgi:hypothetical protein